MDIEGGNSVTADRAPAAAAHGPVGHRLLDGLQYAAAQTPDKIAIVDLEGARRTAYHQLEYDSRRFACFLADLGVTDGDVVTVQLPNWYEAAVAGIGAIRVGAVVNPVLPTYEAKELRHILSVARSVVMISPEHYRGRSFDGIVETAVGAEAAAAIHHIRLPDPHDEPAALGRLVAAATDHALDKRDRDAVSELIFTSGSESTPKGVLHSESTTDWATSVVADTNGVSAGDVTWMPQPVGHSTGFNFGIRLSVARGMTLILQDRWDASVAADLCLREGATSTSVAPTFLFDLIGELESRGIELPGFRYFVCAGAPVSPQAVINAELYGLTVIRGYGSTESLAVSINHPDETRDRRIETDGRVLPGVEIEVRAEDGTLVPVGEPGEIFVRNPGTCLGFAGDPVRTAATISADGWVRMGDIGCVDADGYLTLSGRQKDIIIRGGMNISPREVEDLVRQHPSVIDAVVVGLPHERLGEMSCACVTLKPLTELTVPELGTFLRERGLAVYKLPERLEYFDELPKSEIGKIQRLELREAVEARVRQ
jgi:acyl-coenzyme A synthetase/AMP-(fatty) acid ligase